MEVILATHNVHKIREFRDILKPLKHIDLVSLINYPKYQAPDETGQNFQENARLKAEKAAQALGKWVIAEDSGLVVPAINNEPGVYSRRYSGDKSTDRENNRKLLQKMKGIKTLDRTAYYECAICIASPTGIMKEVVGQCHGRIADEEKGNNGFGYDPLFTKEGYEKTFGELDETTKNRVSHRRKAIDKIMPFLESLK